MARSFPRSLVADAAPSAISSSSKEQNDTLIEVNEVVTSVDIKGVRRNMTIISYGRTTFIFSRYPYPRIGTMNPFLLPKLG